MKQSIRNLKSKTKNPWLTDQVSVQQH